MNELSPWTEEDLKSLKSLDDLLLKKASWSVSTPEAVQLFQTLTWVAKLRDKIERSMVSEVKITKVKKDKSPTDKAT